MKFLNKHHDYIDNTALGKKIEIRIKKRKRRLQIKDKFDEVSPGLYHDYGVIFSHFQHGGIGTIAFRSKNVSQTGGKAIMGPVFDASNTISIANYLIVISYSYLINFKTFSGLDNDQFDKIFLLQYRNVLKSLGKFISKHKKANPKSIDFYDHFFGLTGKIYQ
jgi:hypothetical protein